MITVVGLGNTADELTERAKDAMLKADAVAIRTLLTKSGAAAGKFLSKKGKNFVAFDLLYDSAENFDALNATLVDEILAVSKTCAEIAYCVSGDGFSDAAAVALAKCADVRIVAGVGAHGAKSPCTSCVTVSAYDLILVKPYLDTALPILVTDVDNKMLAGAVKLYLMQFYADDAAVRLCFQGTEKDATLTELDREKKYDESFSCFIAANTQYNKPRYSFGDLLRILDRLTAPDGCPWDKAQTHQSIRLNLIEEAYEAVDAIDSADPDSICEEVGDVLLQAAFHCNIAERTGEFSHGDAISTLCNKLYSRHTHIFGTNKAVDALDALKHWDEAKAVEKNYTSVCDQIARLPDNFPATLRAEKALKKAEKAGFGFTSAELKERITAAADRAAGGSDGGSLLLYAVALLNSVNQDSEVELNKAVKQYAADFARYEKNKKV